ncbi:outer membrane protein assembly factor BamB family protein [Fervidobacterium sp.]
MKKKEQERELRKVDSRRKRAISAVFDISFSYILLSGSMFLTSDTAKGLAFFIAFIFLVVAIFRLLFVEGYRIFTLIYFIGFLLLAISGINTVFPALTLYYLLMALGHMLYYKRTKKRMFSLLAKLSFGFSVADILIRVSSFHFATLLILLAYQILLAYAFSSTWYIDASYFIPKRKAKMSEINSEFELKEPVQIFRTIGEIYSSPFVDDEESVYIVSADATFYKYAFDGKLVWNVDLGSESFSGPLVDTDGNLYVVDNAGEVRNYTRNGEKVWSSKIRKTLTFLPIMFDDKVYVMTFDGNLYEVNSQGTKRKLLSIFEDTELSPLVTADGIYILTSEGKLYKFSIDGKEIWHFITVFVSAMPVLGSDGNLYIGCKDKFL